MSCSPDITEPVPSGNLIYVVPANRWSGVERYILDLARHFSSKGWRVKVLTRDARAVDSLFRRDGLRLSHAPIGDVPGPTSVIAIMRLIKKMRKTNGDAPIVFHLSRYRDALSCLLAARFSRSSNVRIVMTRHYVAPAKKSMIYKYVYSNIDEHIFVSQTAMDEFLSAWTNKDAIPFDTSCLRVIHNSINFSEDISAPERTAGPVTAMYHGRLAPGKGLETLIDAFAGVVRRKVKLRLRILGTGDPDYVDALRARAENLGIMERIDWTRHTADPIPYIRDSHFGVLPSQLKEAFGLANIEYMAVGRPQISTVNGAQAEYLHPDEDSLAIHPGDTDSLTEAMCRLATETECRQAMGLAALENFRKNLSWPRFSYKMEKLYRSLF